MSNIFKGISKNGDLSEALSIAIQSATKELRAEHIRWEMSKISGVYGGFMTENTVEVVISAKSVLPTKSV